MMLTVAATSQNSLKLGPRGSQGVRFAAFFALIPNPATDLGVDGFGWRAGLRTPNDAYCEHHEKMLTVRYLLYLRCGQLSPREGLLIRRQLAGAARGL